MTYKRGRRIKAGYGLRYESECGRYALYHSDQVGGIPVRHYERRGARVETVYAEVDGVQVARKIKRGGQIVTRTRTRWAAMKLDAANRCWDVLSWHPTRTAAETAIAEHRKGKR